MNAAVNHFLDDGAVAPGALGGGVRLPDRSCLVRAYNPDCPAESLEKSMHHLADAAGLFAGHGFGSDLLVWTFANGRLFVTTRPDGALLMLATRSDVDAGEFFSQFAAKFFALTPKRPA